MTQWEYNIIKLPAAPMGVPAHSVNDTLGKLNELGAQGWELVFVWPDASHVLLKRQKETT